MYSILSAASFDCRRAVLPIERAICSDPCLSKLDGKMGEAYRPLSHRPNVRQEQRAWLRQRNQQCGADVECLYDQTFARVVALGSRKRLSRSVHTETTSPPQPKVYSPEPGVVCDRAQGFCADGYGLSIGLTKIFLGTAASETLAHRETNATVFELSNGVFCQTDARICFAKRNDRRVDRAWTKRLFHSFSTPSN
jgi:hypothetical protein